MQRHFTWHKEPVASLDSTQIWGKRLVMVDMGEKAGYGRYGGRDWLW